MQKRKHNPNLTVNAKTLRKNMTKEERHLWYDFLREYPVRCLRQKVIDNYIVDFYCHSARLIIELDGSQHYEEKRQLYDSIRTQQLQEHNLQVIRIPNNAVNENFRGVCEYIDNMIQSRIPQSASLTAPAGARSRLCQSTGLAFTTATALRLPFRQGGLEKSAEE